MSRYSHLQTDHRFNLMQFTALRETWEEVYRGGPAFSIVELTMLPVGRYRFV